jgi:2-polyprenyl-3-methyl-5-hydroxy-6-metoxy-1,4-benzoquinol methylase
VDYDAAYTETRHYFGDAADPVLVRFDHLLNQSRPVLDIGCGQGRNSVYLARQGITVHAFDPSRVAIEQLQLNVTADGFPVYAAVGTFQELRPKQSDYGGILVFGLIQELPWNEIGVLLRLCREHVGQGGLLFFTCFSTEDPSYSIQSKEWEEIGHNSYRNPLGGIRTFLEHDQIIGFFEGFEVVHHWEGLGPEHCHGDGPIEQHGRVEGVFRKP